MSALLQAGTGAALVQCEYWHKQWSSSCSWQLVQGT